MRCRDVIIINFFLGRGWVERTQGRKIQYIFLTCDAYHFFSAPSFHGYSLVVVKLVLIVNLCLTSQLDIFCNLRLGDSLPLTQV